MGKTEERLIIFLIDKLIKKKYSEIFPDDCRCGQKRCDWYIDGDIVEYFGMLEKEAY